jgi:hypothetical protein
MNLPNPLTQLILNPLNDSVCLVLDTHGQHVGNLKYINGLWKFKAIGYDPQGDVLPGGGPLTERHNTTVARLDTAEVSARLLAP